MRVNKSDNRGMDHTTDQVLLELDQVQATEPLPDIEPPRMIDQAVRNMARRAPIDPLADSSASVRAVPKADSLRWIAGLSTVSLALIALGISLIQSPRLPAPEAPAFKTELAEPKADSRLERESISTKVANENLAPPEASAALASDALSSSALEKDAAAVAYKQGQDVAETSVTQAANEVMVSPSGSAERLADESAEPAPAGIASAEAWLDLVRQLYDQGLLADAKEQLRAFNAEYPDHPLPDWAAELQP